jgi:2,5-diketo-D-gluconate reductase A
MQVQGGVIVIPKSGNKNRIADNFALFDFCLSDAQMKEMDALDRLVG